MQVMSDCLEAVRMLEDNNNAGVAALIEEVLSVKSIFFFFLKESNLYLSNAFWCIFEERQMCWQTLSRKQASLYNEFCFYNNVPNFAVNFFEEEDIGLSYSHLGIN